MTQPVDLTVKFLGSMLSSALTDAIGEMAFRLPDEADLRAWIARLDPAAILRPASYTPTTPP
jgi:hypothetical protein